MGLKVLHSLQNSKVPIPCICSWTGRGSFQFQLLSSDWLTELSIESLLANLVFSVLPMSLFLLLKPHTVALGGLSYHHLYLGLCRYFLVVIVYRVLGLLFVWFFNQGNLGRLKIHVGVITIFLLFLHT